ncbi:hypothetical protein J6590_050140 [Homalodisca vitripennis]|nr:hypothetical protein J6590_050140 [Homalodisca vitripennis]
MKLIFKISTLSWECMVGTYMNIDDSIVVVAAYYTAANITRLPPTTGSVGSLVTNYGLNETKRKRSQISEPWCLSAINSRVARGLWGRQGCN